jgi:cytochrome c-type biogenesis protein CcmF
VFLSLMAFTFSMLGAFLVRSGILTSVHAFAIDPTRGTLLLEILGVAAGSGFALFAWRAPSLPPGGLFAPISRESALLLNNLFLSAATVSVLFGTLFPLIAQAFGGAVSVGPPYFNLVFGSLMAAVLLVLPIGPLLAWKRGDLTGVIQRLVWAVGAAAVAGLLVLAFVEPGKIGAALGVALAVWLIGGALTELAERTRFGRVPLAEAGRRMRTLPRGAWGMTLAHIGLGVFLLGAAIDGTGKIEAAQVLGVGQSMQAGAYRLTLQAVDNGDGANFSYERGTLAVTKNDAPICTATPERHFYPAGGQTTSKVALCLRGVSDVYVVFGERRAGPGGDPAWLVRAYWNPWARLIFLGPLLMALGGAVSLSDRRLRIGLPRRARAAGLEPAE